MKENKAGTKHNTGSAKLVLLLTEAEPSFSVSHGNTSTTSPPIRNPLASFNLKQSPIKLMTSCAESGRRTSRQLSKGNEPPPTPPRVCPLRSRVGTGVVVASLWF